MRVLALVVQWDLRLLLWSLGHRDRPRVSRTVRLVSRTGDGYVQVATPIGMWLSESDAARHFAAHLCALFVVERIAYWLLKNGLKRRRPPESVPDFLSLIQASDKFSFPSGHTSAAFLLAALVFEVSTVVGVFALLWATAVGVSRVALGVHFPSDILAGAALGLAVSELAFF